jgi:putative nucleotide binding protein
MMDKKYEDRGIVLDFLPQGNPTDRRPVHLREPLAQIVGDTFFTLLEVVPFRGVTLQPQEVVNIGREGRDKVERIKRRISYEELTPVARTELPIAIKTIVESNPQRFVEFFNRAGPITSRFHALELLPGIGKKLMWAILQEREKQPFQSFEDIENRVKGIQRPLEMIVKRIEMELQGNEKYLLFVRGFPRRA